MAKREVIGVQTLSDDAPIYNFMSTLVSCPDTGYMLLFGGFDELDNLDSNVYLLNLNTMAWEVDSAHLGLFREGHLAVYIGEGNLLVFGGIPHDINGFDDPINHSQPHQDSLDSLGPLDPLDRRMSHQFGDISNVSSTSASAPAADIYTGISSVSDPLYQPLSALHSLHGPMGISNPNLTSSLERLRLITNLNAQGGSNGAGHDSGQFTGTPGGPGGPFGSEPHSTHLALPTSSIPSTDAQIGHMGSQLGTQVVGSSLLHPDRRLADSAFDNGFRASMFGSSGFQGSVALNSSIMLIYNVHSRTWIGPPLFVVENAPPMRSRHACCLSPDGTKVYISGGLVDSEPLNDLWTYDLVSGLWLGPIEFVARFHHSIAEYNGKIYAFGGIDKDMNHIGNNSLAWLDLTYHTVGELVIRQQQQNPENSKQLQHYFLDVNSTVKLDVAVPLLSSANRDFDILAINLEETRYLPLIHLGLVLSLCKDLHSYRWRQAVVMNGILYILGTPCLPTESQPPSSADKLKHVVSVRLSEIGLVSNNQNEKHANLSDDFKRFFLNQEYTDFSIVSLANDTIRADYCRDPDPFHRLFQSYLSKMLLLLLLLLEFDLEMGRKFETAFKVTHVHKAILLARWDHFGRLISSGMKEAAENVMFVPEIHSWVKGMIYYLYSDSVEFSGDSELGLFSIVDYSGMLVLSNVYSLPKMRLMVLLKLYLMTNVLVTSSQASRNPVSETLFEVLIRVWENVILANEPIFLLRLIPFFRETWSSFTRSNVFKDLSKDLIILLCQQCSEITDGANSDSGDTQMTLRSTPEPEMLRAMNVSPETPGRHLRLNHSSLPFLKD